MTERAFLPTLHLRKYKHVLVCERFKIDTLTMLQQLTGRVSVTNSTLKYLLTG
jgi:hypothetical protein